MMFSRIEGAISAVCNEIFSSQDSPVDWMERSEEELFREAIACILGSQVSYEMALAATDALEENGLLTYSGDEVSYAKSIAAVLSMPLYRPEWGGARRYRFPESKAKAISATAEYFYRDGNTFQKFLMETDCPISTRRLMVKNAKGIGPKQASMLLRNIGVSHEFAILDTHLLRFMGMIGLKAPKQNSLSSLAAYEKIEQNFMEYSDRSGWPIDILDQAIWIVMRVYQREVQWAS